MFANRAWQKGARCREEESRREGVYRASHSQSLCDVALKKCDIAKSLQMGLYRAASRLQEGCRQVEAEVVTGKQQQEQNSQNLGTALQ